MFSSVRWFVPSILMKLRCIVLAPRIRITGNKVLRYRLTWLRSLEYFRSSLFSLFSLFSYLILIFCRCLGNRWDFRVGKIILSGYLAARNRSEETFNSIKQPTKKFSGDRKQCNAFKHSYGTFGSCTLCTLLLDWYSSVLIISTKVSDIWDYFSKFAAAYWCISLPSLMFTPLLLIMMMNILAV